MFLFFHFKSDNVIPYKANVIPYKVNITNVYFYFILSKSILNETCF